MGVEIPSPSAGFQNAAAPCANSPSTGTHLLERLREEDRNSDYPAADSLYREELAMGTEVMGENHSYVLVARSNRAERYRETGRPRRAEDLQRAVLQVRQIRYPGHAVRITLSRTALGHTLRAQDQHDATASIYRSALSSLPESLAIRKEKRGPQSWEAAESKNFLGASLAAWERYAEAEPMLHDAHTTLRRPRSSDDPYTRQTLRYLVQFYGDWDKPDQTATWREPSGVFVERSHQRVMEIQAPNAAVVVGERNSVAGQKTAG